MYLINRRNHLAVFSLLFILFWGMCLGNIQTDSSFACSDNCLSENEFSSCSSVIQPVGKAAPVARMYKLETLRQCESVPILRHAVRRAASRVGRTVCSEYAFFHTLLLPLLCRDANRTYVDFQEIISKTVIIEYIHQKDGQKS